MKLIVPAMLIALSLSAAAAEPNSVAKKEIEHLISYLASSECQFYRNGTWYSAARAVSHLSRKYDYLSDRNLVPTAEAFIESVASESSTSGKPYLVRCAGKQDVQSSEWFRTVLKKFREEAKNTAKHH